MEQRDPTLNWPEKFEPGGKPREAGRWDLPFQVIETINENRATRESREKGIQKSLFDIWKGDEGQSFDQGWKNKLIWGDNKYVMSSLLQRFAGKVDLIYIDPPFNTGEDFSYDVEIGNEEILKEPSAIEVQAYRDTWGKGTSSYLEMMYDRIQLMKDLLAPKGSIYVHLDSNVGHYVKVLMDEVFGRENFVNEIIWKRKDAQSFSTRYGVVNDNILFYTKSDTYTFNRGYTDLSKETADNWYRKEEIAEKDTINRIGKAIKAGTVRRYNLADLSAPGSRIGTRAHYEWKGIFPPPGRHWQCTIDVMQKLEKEGRIVYSKSGKPYEKRYLDESKGVPYQTIWDDISMLRGIAKRASDSEQVGFPTQKPEALLERIINVSSNPGDLVADFFCGSGTTLVVAERGGRRWIGCDLSRFAIHASRKRLLGLKGCKPFEILNLGKYERQIWQGLSFSGQNGHSVIYEYLAFVLRLYDAQPISGFQQIHGRKGPALIHVGSVDAPVTIDEVTSSVNETISAKQSELHVLGWEWEMGIHDLVETDARAKGVKVYLRQIPNEVMDPQVSKEGVRFFDLAYVQAKAAAKKTSVQVELEDFGIPSSELIRDEVRKKIRHWSDLVDYWAIDFDFKNDTFLNSWQAYRTQDSPKLELKSASHDYEKHGKHQVLVKVVDIFGIDSSKLLEVEV